MKKPCYISTENLATQRLGVGDSGGSGPLLRAIVHFLCCLEAGDHPTDFQLLTPNASAAHLPAHPVWCSQTRCLTCINKSLIERQILHPLKKHPVEGSEGDFISKRTRAKKGGDWLMLVPRAWRLPLLSGLPSDGGCDKGPHLILLSLKVATGLSSVTKWTEAEEREKQEGTVGEGMVAAHR